VKPKERVWEVAQVGLWLSPPKISEIDVRVNQILGIFLAYVNV